MEDYKDLNDYEIMYMVEENDEEAKELLYKKYMPLIYKYADRYYRLHKNCGLDKDDFIQEGYYAVFCAYKTYNSNKDALFFTYVDLCIRSKMHNLVVRNTSLKHQILNTSISLNRPVDNQDGKELIDILSDNKQILPDDEFYKNQLFDLVKKNLYAWKISDAAIFELYYNGFSHIDISHLLGRDKRAVSSTICRLKKKLNSIEKGKI